MLNQVLGSGQTAGLVKTNLKKNPDLDSVVVPEEAHQSLLQNKHLLSDAGAQVTARIMQGFVSCTGIFYRYYIDSSCSLLNDNKPRTNQQNGTIIALVR